jgi:putative transposase
MDQHRALADLSESERDQAVARFRILQPFLDGQTSLTAIAREQAVTLRTLQRWVTRYRSDGLVGLARKGRTDRGQHRMDPELQRLIEGLALQPTRPSAAAIHRQIIDLAASHGWEVPSYSCVYAIVHHLDPAMVVLAHEGGKAYQDVYDLVYRREASRPNAIWQADHTLLNLWLLDQDGQPARPWLTVIEDDYSRSIAGYYLTFAVPNALNTALAFRQAIWRKSDPRWQICGIPDIFYTDHGSDFTSRHIEQVCADLTIQLIFSTVGVPRGRGRIERFFQTVDQLLLHRLPGYAPEAHPLTPPALTLETFDPLFQEFLLGEYHLRSQRDLPMPPQARWQAGGFLPRLPDSLEQLDLLLLTVAKQRRVRRDGIHFQGLRYLDPTLAAYVGEDVVIRYDPRDLAEIRVYHRSVFLCRAVCQELADKTISLKEIVRARNQRRRDLRTEIKDRADLVETYVKVHQEEVPAPISAPPQAEQEGSSARRLKLYEHE